MADKTEKLTLLAQIDERTIRRSIELTRQLEKATDNLTYSVDDEEEANKQLARGLDGVNKKNDDAIQGIRDRIKALREENAAIAKQIGVEEKLADTRKAATEAGKADKGADLGKVERGVASVSQLVPGAGGELLRGFGDVVGAADDLKPLVGEITKLATAGPIASAAIAKLGLSSTVAAGGVGAAAVSVGALTLAILPVAAAIAAVTIAFQKFQKDLEAQKAVLEGAIDNQRHYYEVIQTGSKESIQAELEAAQVRQRAANQLRADLQRAFGDLSAIEKLSPAGAQLKKNIEELDTEIRINADSIERLTKAMNSGEVAARDAAAAQAQAAQETVQAEKPAIEARKQETAAINASTLALQQAAQTRKDEAAQRQTIIQSTVKYRADLITLEKSLAAERVKINSEAAASIKAIGDELVASIDAAKSEAAAAQSAADRQLEAEIAATETQSAERQIAITQETNNRVAELRERHKQDLERIERDYNSAARTARFNRDAVALDEAQRQREDATKEANSELKTAVRQERQAGRERLKEQRKNDEQRIRDLRAAAIQETVERRIVLEQRILDLQAAAQAEIMTVNQAKDEALKQLLDRFAQERAQRTAAYQQEQSQLAQHLTALVNLNLSGLNTITAAWQTFFAGLSNGIAGSGAAIGANANVTGGSGGITYAGHLGGFAAGVRNFSGGLAMVGERGPELAMLAKGTSIYSNEDTKEILGGIAGDVNVSIYTKSSDAKGIMREVKRQFPNMLTEAIEGLY